METMINREGFELLKRADIEQHHELVVAVKQNNLDLLEEMVLERSTPGE